MNNDNTCVMCYLHQADVAQHLFMVAGELEKFTKIMAHAAQVEGSSVSFDF
jgi:hypothetical protein